jgi:hypothetical protein
LVSFFTYWYVLPRKILQPCITVEAHVKDLWWKWKTFGFNLKISDSVIKDQIIL